MNRDVERASQVLARRALLITMAATIAGSSLGILGIALGAVGGIEVVFIIRCLLFSASSLLALLAFPKVPLETVAFSATIFFSIYLCLYSVKTSRNRLTGTH